MCEGQREMQAVGYMLQNVSITQEDSDFLGIWTFHYHSGTK